MRLADHDVNCECKFYVRRGYLCRHAFASLHQCGVSKIPLAFINTHWTKNAENQPSGFDKSAVCKMRTHIQAMKVDMKELVTHKEATIDKFVDPQPHSDVVVQNPNTSRNKGCGI